MQASVQDWAHNNRNPLQCRVRMVTEERHPTSVGDGNVSNPSCKRVNCNSECGPPFTLSDISETRLSLLHIDCERRQDLFIVLRFFL